MGALECFEIKTLKHDINGVKSIFSQQTMKMATKAIVMNNTFVMSEWRQQLLHFKKEDRKA